MEVPAWFTRQAASAMSEPRLPPQNATQKPVIIANLFGSHAERYIDIEGSGQSPGGTRVKIPSKSSKVRH